MRIDSRYVKLFEEIMGFLLRFITKDKQVDALFEKICQRFIHAENAGKDGGKILAECFSYCLSILPLTAKTIFILNDNMSHVKPFLTSRRVFKNFTNMIQNNRRNAKSGELKDAIEELEETLTKIHAKIGDENEDEVEDREDSEEYSDDDAAIRSISRSVSRAVSRTPAKRPSSRHSSKTPAKSGRATPAKSGRSTPSHSSSMKKIPSSRMGSKGPPKKSSAQRRIFIESDSDSD
uniref:Cnd3 domain-containing protein n=1 Tax=Steinernema glaseri TaxID=37863 RepID=A0A1I8A8H7_9BILA